MISDLLKLVNQIKILHWQTSIYSQHEAFGKIYDELSDLIDLYVEIFIGKYGKIKSKHGFDIKLDDISTVNINSFVEESCEYLLTTFVKSLDTNKDTDLFNIRDEMLAQLNKLKYLLTLK
jgi:DNA-binding ferritin-like protein